MGEGRRFTIQRTLGQGSYGSVYLAEMESAGGFRRRVALKLLRPGWEPSSDAARRMRDEARILGRLDHPNIVRVEDLLQIEGRWGIVMEYVAGTDLEKLANDLAASGSLMPVQAALQAVAGVADACLSAWEAMGDDGQPMRVIHRDLKPSNLRLSASGSVKVLDFGVARADLADRHAVTDGVRYGSLGYMGPERLFTEKETPAGDVWALGVILYELLSLQPWGPAEVREEKHAAAVRAAGERVAARGGVEIDAVAALVEACLAYEPDARPPMRELRDRARELAAKIADGDLVHLAQASSGKLDIGSDADAGRVLCETTGGAIVSGETIVAPDRGPGPPDNGPMLQVISVEDAGPEPPSRGPLWIAGGALAGAVLVTALLLLLLPSLRAPADPSAPPVAPVAAASAAGAPAPLEAPATGPDATEAPAPGPDATAAPAGAPGPAPAEAAPAEAATAEAAPAEAAPGAPEATPTSAQTKTSAAREETTTVAARNDSRGRTGEAATSRAAAPASGTKLASSNDAGQEASSTATSASSATRLRSAKFSLAGGSAIAVRCGDRSGSGETSVLLRDLPAGACTVSAGGASTTVQVDTPRGVSCTLDAGSLSCR